MTHIGTSVFENLENTSNHSDPFLHGMELDPVWIIPAVGFGFTIQPFKFSVSGTL